MAPAWEALQGLAAWRVTGIPRQPQRQAASEPAGDLLALQRVAALTSAYHAGGPVAFGWIRHSAGGPVRVLAAGQALAAGTDGGHTWLTLPAGGRGEPLGGRAAAELAGRLGCWVRIAAVCDGLLAGQAQPGDRTGAIGPSLDDGPLATWPGSFGWLLLAEPAGRTELGELTQAIALALGVEQKYDSPKAQLRARRLGMRYTELRQSAAAGLWHVHLLAGAATPRAAAQVAGLVCTSADLRNLPYALQPLPGCASAPEILAAPIPGGAEDPAEPVPEARFRCSSALLAALAQPPAQETPGVRFVLRPEFDVTPGLSPGTAGQADEGPGPAGEADAGIPWLVVEPAKAEYKLMAARLPGTEVIRIAPGSPDEIPAGINPLQPAAGPGGTRFPLQAHGDLVRALFLAAFEAEEPFPQVLAAALSRCYTEAGWDLALGEPAVGGVTPGYPSLGDLQATAEQVVNEIGYGREITDNVRGFIKVRIASLRLGTTGRFFEGGHPLDMAALLDRNVVLEIEDVGDDADKALLIGTVLIRLAGHLRMRQREEGPARTRLRQLTVIEEADVIKNKSAPAPEYPRRHLKGSIPATRPAPCWCFPRWPPKRSGWV